MALIVANLTMAQSSIEKYNWVYFNNTSSISPDRFWKTYQSKMDLSSDYSLKVSSESDDEIGYMHQRFDQYYKGYKIEAAQYLLHSQGGKVQTANGRLVNGITASNQVGISFSKALEFAKSYVPGTEFYWENPEMEALIKDIHHNPTETFYPEEEIVWLDPKFTQDGANYSLAYKFELYYEGESDHQTVFVSAQDGKLLHTLDGCQHSVAQGTAVTKYHGTVDIVTDQVSNNLYVLKDATRGGGIETYDMNNGTRTSNSVDFQDSDNYWNNANAQIDEVAGDVHWSSEMTYDYFKSVHNRKSYNDRDSKIVSYVHYSTNWQNASWNGQFARYGDGTSGQNPLTSIDVISHELSHGVTGNSAGLVYQDEPGALNESFSDIFGTAAEFWAMPTGSARWEMGGPGFMLRDISNPNRFNDPDTYKGSFWHTAATDNGGVHVNSSVQNFWFYLLCVGGTGTNDKNQPYNVPSIGMDKAEKISYRNLTRYLSGSSQYVDAREGSIQSAKDLYGACSAEANAVAAAWHAVGLGLPVLTDDVQFTELVNPKSNCSLGSSESISVRAKYEGTGCNTTLTAGDTILFGYSLNGGTIVTEQYVLPQNLSTGNDINYTFKAKEDFSTKKLHEFDVFVNFSGDQYLVNDSSLKMTIKNQISVSQVDTITFEQNMRAKEDIMYSEIEGTNAKVYRFGLAANTGSFGIALTGKDFDIGNFAYHIYEEDNFTRNPEFEGKACMCVDAREWSKFTLEFDLRQTYSQMHTTMRSFNRPQVQSSMLITANGVQIGSQYHPDTYSNDPWKTYQIKLDSLAGQEINLCFEGKHFINTQQESVSTYGDNSFIDNVHFVFSQPGAPSGGVGQNEEVLLSDQFNIYPNPTNGNFFLSVASNLDKEGSVEVINVQGQVIFKQPLQITEGQNLVPITLTNQPKGLYVVHMQLNGDQLFKQIVIE